MNPLVEAVRSGRFSRRTFLEAAGLTLAGLAVRSEFAYAAEVPNDFRNLTYLIHPDAVQVSIDHGTFWDYGRENANKGIIKLEIDMLVDMANRGTLGSFQSEIPVIMPTEPLPNNQSVDLQERISTREDATKLYGVKDKRSSLPEAWDINQWGQAVLKSEDTLTPVIPNGAVVDTWYNSKNGPQGVIIRPDVSEFKIPGGTFWRFGTNSEPGVRQIVRGQMERGFNPYVFYSIRGRLQPVGLARMFVRKQELVDRFGVAGTRSATFNLPGDPVWDINEFGGATLWPNPDGTRTPIRPNGAVIEVKGS